MNETDKIVPQKRCALGLGASFYAASSARSPWSAIAKHAERTYFDERSREVRAESNHNRTKAEEQSQPPIFCIFTFNRDLVGGATWFVWWQEDPGDQTPALCCHSDLGVEFPVPPGQSRIRIHVTCWNERSSWIFRLARSSM